MNIIPTREIFIIFYWEQILGYKKINSNIVLNIDTLFLIKKFVFYPRSIFSNTNISTNFILITNKALANNQGDINKTSLASLYFLMNGSYTR